MTIPAASTSGAARPRDPEGAIFLTLFVCYAYFFQGGGWNQESRFDQARAIVESGRLAINDYMTYAGSPGGDATIQVRRLTRTGAALRRGEKPIDNTGDTATYEGLVYPNKPPGTTFLAVPAYGLLSLAEAALLVDRDDWWAMTINAYLTTALSIGLLGAFGGVIFYRASRRLFPSIAPVRHAAAALTLGLGTLYFPFATALFDHLPVAVFSLLSFGLLLAERDRGAARDGPPATTADRLRLAAAGLAAGLAVLNNYAAALTVLLLTLYAFSVCRPRSRVLLFLAGGVPPALALGAYHAACFGRALTLATSYESDLFTAGGKLWLGVFGAPDPGVLVRLLFSSYRGLFFSSPVLLLASYGLWRMWTRLGLRPEAGLCLGIFGAFLVMNASFNGWHGGYSFGPRYLIPAVPFLALPLAPAFDRLPRLAAALALTSAAMIFLATAVDPQVPFDLPRPWSGYLLPLAAGETVAHPPDRIEGPVSANPQGVCEKFAHDIFRPGSAQSAWSSFNLGEFLWPGSLMSLLPLLIAVAAGARIVLLRAGGSPGGRAPSSKGKR